MHNHRRFPEEKEVCALHLGKIAPEISTTESNKVFLHPFAILFYLIVSQVNGGRKEKLLKADCMLPQCENYNFWKSYETKSLVQC